MTSFELAGLSSTAAAEQRRIDGPNELIVTPPTPAWRQLAAQFFHFFALLLWVAGVLAVVAGMAELGLAIFLVIVMNGVFAFVQEHRAERAAHKLQELVPRRAVALRDGAWTEIEARDLVTGDLVALTAGDRLSADLLLVQGRGLLIDTSTLTGESVPVSVSIDESAFAGTFVVEGEAVARVVATGTRTRLADIAKLTQSRRRPRPPLARELDRLVRIVAIAAGSIGALFFTVGWLVGLPLREGFLFSIGVAVALVPEGLLPTVTLSLALGASRMSKKGALVRRLEAVETLGSTTFICSDKTGTLTKNEMNVVEVWTPLGVALVHGRGYEPVATFDMAPAARGPIELLALAGARCSSGRALQRGEHWVARGDPMESALYALALRLGIDVTADERRRPETTRFPFDPHRKRMSTLVGGTVYVKGAPGSVLSACANTAAAESAASEMAARGLRVLAIATRALDPVPEGLLVEQMEANLTLLGLVGLKDPPRAEARSALEACHRAGLRVAMVTGDHAGTARAIAEEVGLRADLVVSGDELPEDDAILGALLDRDGVVACRVSPEQKLRIARALQARGHVVAMTGDGVNDGPALRQADIGIAMGHSGTDVAREASDLVLLDDRFETIVLAIEQGRSTFANIRRFLTYHLTDNVAELAPFVLWALSGGRFPLALGVLQILCLDLLTDQLPALALGAEPPNPRALATRPQGRHIIDAPLLLRALGVLGPVEALVSMLAFVTVLLGFGWTPVTGLPPASTLVVASGTAFVAIVFGQTATAIACRSSSQPFWEAAPRKNPLLWIALSVSWLIVAALLYVPSLAQLLGQAPPTAQGLAVAALAFPLVLCADTIYKRARRRPRRP